MLTRVLVPAAIALSLAAGVPSAKAQSPAECDAYARGYANRQANPPGDVLGGALGGAVTGAILGGIFGGGKGAGQGAAIGGGIGAFGGAAHASNDWHGAYQWAFDDCMMSGAQEAAYAPAQGSPAWYRYCAAKYRSFNPETGRFLSNSGEWKVCR